MSNANQPTKGLLHLAALLSLDTHPFFFFFCCCCNTAAEGITKNTTTSRTMAGKAASILCNRCYSHTFSLSLPPLPERKPSRALLPACALQKKGEGRKKKRTWWAPFFFFFGPTGCGSKRRVHYGLLLVFFFSLQFTR